MCGTPQPGLSSGAAWGSRFGETQWPTTCPLEHQGQCMLTPGGASHVHQLKPQQPPPPHPPPPSRHWDTQPSPLQAGLPAPKLHP